MSRKRLMIMVLTISLIILSSIGGFIIGKGDNRKETNYKDISGKFSGINIPIANIHTEELNTGKLNKLTLELVKKLSKKGDELSWEDFKTYDGKDIGSGLYIMMYPIDDKYTILIGGGSLKERPMYIYLVNNNIKDNEKRIDIRHDDIDKFINNMS